MNNIELVPYTDEDYDFVYEVKKNAYKKYVEECWGAWVEEDQRKYFEKFIATVKNNTFIIKDGTKKIGFYNGKVLANGNYEVGNICIIPEYHGKGIGTEIVKYVNNYIYENYICDCIVLRPFKRNERTVKFYEKCGFEIVDEYVESDTLGNKGKMIVLLNKPDRWTFDIDGDRLVNLVLDGKKTATTSLYELDNISEVGYISILTDTKDNNVCFIKTSNVIVTELKNITWDLAKLEGENKSLNEWKESHINYFKKLDPNFNENTRVIFEVFEVIKKCK